LPVAHRLNDRLQAIEVELAHRHPPINHCLAPHAARAERAAGAGAGACGPRLAARDAAAGAAGGLDHAQPALHRQEQRLFNFQAVGLDDGRPGAAVERHPQVLAPGAGAERQAGVIESSGRPAGSERDWRGSNAVRHHVQSLLLLFLIILLLLWPLLCGLSTNGHARLASLAPMLLGDGHACR
jgi:hypothetical protein